MRTGWRLMAAGAGLATLVIGAAAGGCGSSRKTAGGDQPPAQPPSALNFELVSADVPASGQPVVRFRVTDQAGQPIDVAGEIQASDANDATRARFRPRFTLAQLQDAGDYVSYFEDSVTGGGRTVTQAVADPPTRNAQGAAPFPMAQLADEGGGVWRYTFSTPDRSGLDRSKVHTVGVWATRTVPASGGAEEQAWPASATLNFVPGQGNTTQGFRTIEDAACNTCHGVLEAHDARRGTQLCLTCHSPQSTDPESGNTVDFKVMVHKIHRGAGLPSVRSGTPYRVIGFQGSVHDFSDVNFPRSIHDCTACHQGPDADAWKSRPTVAACSSCHDNLRLDGTGTTACGPGVTASCNHRGGAVGATANCAGCHTPDSVAAAHVDPALSQVGRFRYEIVSAAVDAERRPVVQFRVIDPASNGAPYDITAAGGPFTQPGGASSLAVVVGWPAAEYTNEGSGLAYGQPISMNALTAATPVPGQAGVYQVTTAPSGNTPAATVPAGVQALTVFVEGHPAVNGQRIPVPNAVQHVALAGGAAPARRQVVAVERCNACHGLLTAHGANRNGTTESCAVCHNANATDKRRRPAGVQGEEAIDFKVLIHEVHAVGVRENPVTVYGFGGTAHVFPIGTGNVADCSVCHVGTSYVVPLQEMVRDTAIATGADPLNPADDARRPRTQAVCLSCHDTATDHVAQHTQGTTETCQQCHAAGGVEDVSRVHPVTTR